MPKFLREFFNRSELTQRLYTLRKEFIVAAIFTAVINVLMLTPTLYMLQLFDRVLMSYSLFTLIALSLVALFFFVVSGFSQWIRSKLLIRTGVKLDKSLNPRVFKAAFESRLNQSKHKANINNTPTQAFDDLIAVRQFMTGNGFFAFMDAPWSPIYIIVLFLLHPLLGVLSLVFSAILICIALYTGGRQHKPLEFSGKTGFRLNLYSQSKMKNLAVVEAMGMRDKLRSLWREKLDYFVGINGTAHDISAKMQGITKFATMCQQSLTLAAGAILVIKGDLTAGSMIAANVLMGRVTQPLMILVSTWKQTLTVRDAFLRLEKLLKDYPEKSAGFVGVVPSGNVSVKNLTATANGRAENNPILNNISCDFVAGNVIAIVGSSGAGKSTFARCLVGIWANCILKNPTSDGVLYDQEPISHWDRNDLGQWIGYLPQDVELFEGTIAENVARFGEVDAQKVIKACQRAGVHEMILRFPQGYDTNIGLAGSHLSGGQRQRIGLARALYGDPSIVVLDEPNANLDDAGEKALEMAILDLKARHKTVFLITHRQNILQCADKIMRVQNGKISDVSEEFSAIKKLQN